MSEEGNENCRGTKEGEDVSENWTKFTVPSFKEQLWKHAISAIVPVPEIDALFQEIVAVVRICIWRKFRDAFELQDCVGEILLVDPDCPPERRANIHRNVTHRRLLRQYAEQSAFLIGQRYAKLVLNGDVAGREKLEKLIGNAQGVTTSHLQCCPRGKNCVSDAHALEIIVGSLFGHLAKTKSVSPQLVTWLMSEILLAKNGKRHMEQDSTGFADLGCKFAHRRALEHPTTHTIDFKVAGA